MWRLFWVGLLKYLLGERQPCPTLIFSPGLCNGSPNSALTMATRPLAGRITVWNQKQILSAS